MRVPANAAYRSQSSFCRDDLELPDAADSLETRVSALRLTTEDQPVVAPDSAWHVGVRVWEVKRLEYCKRASRCIQGTPTRQGGGPWFPDDHHREWGRN